MFTAYAQAGGLLPLKQLSMDFYGRLGLGYHDFKGIALSFDEQQRLVADLGDFLGMSLRNHGLLTVGETAQQAFLRIYYLEKSCDIQIAAQIGGELIIPSDEVCRCTERRANESHKPLGEGEISLAGVVANAGVNTAVIRGLMAPVAVEKTAGYRALALLKEF